MGTVVLLVGPKAVGKSWVAETIRARLGVAHVDADLVILEVLKKGERADPVNGWLLQVKRAVDERLSAYTAVSVEATGAWDSDYLLADLLEADGHRVVRVLLTAPEDVTLARLAAREPR